MPITAEGWVKEDDSTLTDAEIDAVCESRGALLRPYLYRIRDKDIQNRSYRHRDKLDTAWSTIPLLWPARDGVTAYKGGDYHRHFGDLPRDGRVRNGEIARLVLRDSLGKRSITKRHSYTYTTPAPLYFQGYRRKQRSNYLAEVDIRACYGQMLSKLPGPKLRYDPEEKRFTVNPEYRWDQAVVSNKYVGRALAGMFYHYEQTVFHYGQLRYFPSAQWYAPQIIDWLNDCLHAIAIMAVNEGGCVRWHTDGGLFIGAGAAETFINYLEKRWGLYATIKQEGWGYVTGINRYLIVEETLPTNFKTQALDIEDNLDRRLDIGFLRASLCGEILEASPTKEDGQLNLFDSQPSFSGME